MSILQRKEVKFVLCIIGIYGSFIYYGVMQEQLFKTTYTNDKNETGKFNFPFAIILFFSLISSIIGFFININDPKQRQIVPIKDQAKQGLLVLTSGLSSNTALAYVSYPVQALAKSSKVLSVLMVGLLFGKSNYSKKQYITGLIITAGVFGFNLLSITLLIQSGEKSSEMIGFILLFLSLFSDGMVADEQQLVRKNHPRLNSFEMMRYTSTFSGLFALLYGSVRGQLIPFIHFCIQFPKMLQDLMLITLLSTCGQIFIFYTISNFGPLSLSIMTTTRKLFTVVFSIIIHSHPINNLQLFCIFLVFSGVGVELADSYFKKKGPQKQQ